MKKIAIINGANLNLLGTREPEIYGPHTLVEIQKYTSEKLKNYAVDLDWFQSNIEGEIVNFIQIILQEQYDALVINPGGYSHTSVVIYDALKMLPIPIIEVHLTNVYSRESFRQCLLTAKASSIIMSGLGKDAYYMAVLSQIKDKRD